MTSGLSEKSFTQRRKGPQRREEARREKSGGCRTRSVSSPPRLCGPLRLCVKSDCPSASRLELHIAQVAGLARPELEAGGEVPEEGKTLAGADIIGHARDQSLDAEATVFSEGLLEAREGGARAELAIRVSVVDPDAAKGMAVLIEQAAGDGAGRLEADGQRP